MMLFSILMLLGLMATSAPADDLVVSPPTPEMKLDAIYTKTIRANGYLIIATKNTSDYALKEAAYLVNQMLANRPDVREAMIKSGSRMCILAHNEFTTDLPEFQWLKPKEYWDARARGTGGSQSDPYCSCGEENLLGYDGDPYSTECILIHEFAHNIHLRGLVKVDPTFDKRVKEAYDRAMKEGLWKGKYSSTNHHEYFAEGVQSWFDNNRENDHDHNHVNTRKELLDYDPRLATLCREVFGDTEIKYTKPVTRLKDHLAGYDPKSSPKFVWPERLKKAKDEIRAKAVVRDKGASEKPDRETRMIAGWQVHVSKSLLEKNADVTKKALELLQMQLEEIDRVVPKGAVVELKKVPLWISPEYEKIPPRAEYHPDASWLKSNHRDAAMAKGIEFTNVRIFEAETRRMPNFALHELAHAYHDRVLGFEESKILAAYDAMKKAGTYEKVERVDSEGRKSTGKHYALSNHKEYFAESTEAFFVRNDFFPYNRDELKRHDLDMFKVLGEIWKMGAE